MGDKSKIEWTEATLNITVGCTKASSGCQNCYAERVFPRAYPDRKFSDLRLFPDRLEQPLRWKKPRMIFVNSMSDLFHEAVPTDFIKKFWDVMARCPQHTFQVLTKRSKRMAELSKNLQLLPNVWMGVSAENQRFYDERVIDLQHTHAQIKFVSCEPLIGPIKLGLGQEGHRYQCGDCGHIASADVSICSGYSKRCSTNECSGYACVCGLKHSWRLFYASNPDWVIIGGESGPKARPMDEAWVRAIIEECAKNDVPVFYKQRIAGGRKISMPEIDGRTWAQMPKVCNGLRLS